MSDVYGKFLKPLLHVFKPSENADDRKMWVSLYKSGLQDFPDEVLSGAAEKIIASRENGFFPLPAECVAVCRQMSAEMIAQRRGQYRTRAQVSSDDWERRSKIADGLFAKYPEAQRAVKEQWWWRLWSWMQEHTRAPDVHELRLIEAKGKADYENYLVDINGNIYGRTLDAWRNIAYRRISGLLTIEDSDGQRYQAVGEDR